MGFLIAGLWTVCSLEYQGDVWIYGVWIVLGRLSGNAESPMGAGSV